MAWGPCFRSPWRPSPGHPGHGVLHWNDCATWHDCAPFSYSRTVADELVHMALKWTAAGIGYCTCVRLESTESTVGTCVVMTACRQLCENHPAHAKSCHPSCACRTWFACNPVMTRAAAGSRAWLHRTLQRIPPAGTAAYRNAEVQELPITCSNPVTETGWLCSSFHFTLAAISRDPGYSACKHLQLGESFASQDTAVHKAQEHVHLDRKPAGNPNNKNCC